MNLFFITFEVKTKQNENENDVKLYIEKANAAEKKQIYCVSLRDIVIGFGRGKSIEILFCFWIISQHKMKEVE